MHAAPTVLFSDDYYQDPYPAFAWLQTHSPMHEFTFPIGNIPMWMVTRFDDVRRLHADPRFSTSPHWAGTEFLNAGIAVGAGTPIERIVTMLDPPDHTRVRRLLTGTFTARRVNSWRNFISSIVGLELDRLTSQPQPDIADFASAIAAHVMGYVLGRPLDYSTMIHAIERAFRFEPGQNRGSFHAFKEITDYAEELIRATRRNPGDNLASALVSRHYDDSQLSGEELIATIAVMIMAGLDTTRNLIVLATLCLLDNPGQHKLLIDNPSLVEQAVEEFIRYTGGVALGFFRFAKHDLEFAGATVPAGTAVLSSLAGANRDPRCFADPDRLDITRTRPRHIGFGYGIHNCPGAPLARLTAATAVQAIAAQFPHLALAIPRENIRYENMWLVRSIPALPVHLDGPHPLR